MRPPIKYSQIKMPKNNSLVRIDINMLKIIKLLYPKTFHMKVHMLRRKSKVEREKSLYMTECHPLSARKLSL